MENLKKICDEVFGFDNHIETIVWKNKYGAAAYTVGFISVHEYILCYSRKPIANITSELDEDGQKAYNKRDEKFAIRGGYMTQPLMTTSLADRPNLMYSIQYNGTTIKPRKQWVWGKEKLETAIANNEVEFNLQSDGLYSVRSKAYLKDENGKMRRGKPLSLMNGPFNQEGTKDVKNLFGDKAIFDFTKPTQLIKYLLALQINDCSNDDFIVLDFFSGSATTAHAVMQMNAEDGGHRKFILVQLPEKCDENSEAAKAGYKTICEIGKERIRRAGDQILELSLQNLEKEGIVEKYARELPEIRSLEEVYGSSGIGLRPGEEVAEGGNIRSVGSNSQGCGVDSVEHSGGAISGEQGVCPVFENSKGITSGTGNTIVDLRTLKILNENGYRIKLEALGRNQQNDLFADKAFDIKGLSSKLSVLNSDRGFRVLKIDDSNMKDVYYSAGEISQQDLVEQISNIKDGRTDLDLLFGCLVDWGVPLSLPIKTETIENLQVYNVNDGDLVACFANDIPEAAIRQIAAAKPLRAVFRDSSFKSDSAKINVTEIFKTISPSTTVKVI